MQAQHATTDRDGDLTGTHGPIMGEADTEALLNAEEYSVIGLDHPLWDAIYTAQDGTRYVIRWHDWSQYEPEV